MSKLDPETVTNCTRCNASLERGYSSRWVGDECKEVICFKCNSAENLEEHMKTGIIRTNFLMDAMMDVYDIVRNVYGRGSEGTYDEAVLLELLDKDYPETTKAKFRVQLASTRIQKRIKDFDAKVWFKGLQDQILATKCRGFSAKLGKEYDNFKVLTWTCAGRTMITIEDDHASVTAVADETSKESRTGFHGINATGEQALALIDKAISLYEAGVLKFKDDEKVSMI